jgi:hypothetical protein
VARLARALARRQVLQRDHHVGQRAEVRKQRVVLEDEADTPLLRRDIDAAAGVEPGFVAAAHAAA